MANAMFGWQNALPAATITGGSEALPAQNVGTDQGSSANAWQTAAGTTTSYFVADTGSSATTWRAFLLARTNLTSAATVRWRVGPREAFYESAPTVSTDFTTAWSAPSGWTFSRATAAYAFNASGVLTSYAANTARPSIDPGTLANTGLLFEEARTNLVTNPAAVGAIAGSPGTTATSWSQIAQNGIAFRNVGIIADHGVPGCDCRWIGTTTALTSEGIYFETTTGIAATTGQVFTLSAFLSLTAGSLANITAMQLAIVELDSGGTALNTQTAAITGPTSTNLAQQRVQATFTVGQATTAYIRPLLRFTANNGAAIDVTIRIGCPQVEKAPQASSPMFPASGTGAFARAADVAYVTVGALSGVFTLGVDLDHQKGIGSDIVMALGDGSTAGNATQMAYSSAANVAATMLSGGSAWSANSGLTVPFATATRGRAMLAGDSSLSSTAGTGGSVNSGAVSLGGLPAAATKIYFGGDPANGGAATGLFRIRKFAFWATKLTVNQVFNWVVNGVTTNATAVTYDSGVVAAGVAAGYGQSVVIAPAQIAGQCVRCDIVDTANTDTFLSVGLAYAGPVWQPAVNPTWASTVGRDQQVDEVVTRGGQEFPVLRWSKRRWSVQLQAITSAEAWPQVMALDLVARAGGNVLFVPDPSGAYLQQEATFGRCKPKPDLVYAQTSFNLRGWSADLTERL